MNNIESKIYEMYEVDPKLLKEYDKTHATSIEEQYKQFIKNARVVIGIDLGMDKDITIINKMSINTP